MQELEDETASIADGYEFSPWANWKPVRIKSYVIGFVFKKHCCVSK